MKKTSAYKLLENLNETNNFLIYRGRKKNDDKTYIIKVLKNPELASKFKQEYKLTASFENEGIIQVYEMAEVNDSPAIIMEDIGGQSLGDILKVKKLNLDEFLNFTIQLAEIIGNIHKHNVIHKDINPSNIIWNVEKDIVRIIDFGIATELPREITSVKNPSILEGTLSYLSPEQTGRMNRALDYRTDFYSLGIIFYRILTGRLPFESNDLLTLVHSHIAIQPVSPDKINENIPEVISRIVMKLMSKNAEDRYMSAHGLKADLLRCIQDVKESGKIHSFELGFQDKSESFLIPQKLYGREQAIATLMSAMERVKKNDSELMLVSGLSGIGKSMLINEIHKPVIKHSGYFISGKFEKLTKDVPYSAIIQAFTKFATQILAEGDESIAEWKEKISSALGPNGKIITDIIPSFELIIGKQPDIPDLSPIESQNRFGLVFQWFIKALADKEHPLVMFLDDLQWADLASLLLLKLFTSNSDIKHLFMVGAYRHNETPDSHPLILTLDEIKKSGTTVNNISLLPLALKDISKLLVDTLNCPAKEVNSLAELLIRKTRGNPFFVNEFLKSLYKDSLIEFSFENGWAWDMAEIEKRQVTDNVVNMMAERITDLSEQSQEILKTGACIGNRFSLSDLITVCGNSEKDILSALNEILQQEMLNNIDDIYTFNHDRIQEAAYSLISNEKKAQEHYRIGTLELNNADDEEVQKKIFYIVNHLNAGVNLVSKEPEKFKLAQLNYTAGGKAFASNAYTSALNYFNAGIELLEENCWLENYDFTLALYQEAVSAAQNCADYEKFEQLAEEVYRNARTVLDTIKVSEAKILTCMAQNQLIEGIQFGLNVLRDLGVRLPEKPGKLRTVYELLRVKMTLIGKPIESLIDLPEITDPHQYAVMQIISRIGLSAYIAIPELFPIIVFTMVRLSVKNGNTGFSPYAYAAYGVVHCGVLGDVDAGYKWGQLAQKYVAKFDVKNTQSRVWFVVWYVINHWKIHLRDSANPFLEAYKVGLETGDLEFAAFSADACSNLLHLGVELEEVAGEMAKYAEILKKISQDTILNYNSMHRQVVYNLRGLSADPCKFTGPFYHKDKMMPVHLEASDNLALFFVYCYLLNLNYLFGNHNEALKYADLLEPICDEQISHPFLPIICYYDSLIRLSFCSTTEGKIRKKHLKKIAKNQKKMKKWAHHAPMNYEHKYQLVEAETARIKGDKLKAITHYKDAVKLAKENKFLQEEALALELTAKFWLELGDEKIAGLFMTEAYNTYLKWGATAKTKNLEENFQTLLASAKAISKSDKIKKLVSSGTVITDISEGLDLSSIMESASAFASILNRADLLKRVIEITVKNAGATNGILLLKRGENFFIEVDLDAQGRVTMAQPQPLDRSSTLAVSVVNYVIHTKKFVVLDDAAHQGDFTSDPWIKKNQVKSLIASALLHQGEITGVFYAENNIVNGAFTEDRLVTLKMLSTQAAISIKNAQLFENIKKAESEVRELNVSLEKRVEERTETLNQTLEKVEEANSLIMSSINYSSVIQKSLLPDPAQITATIPDSFFIWQPRDVIGGDIYYFDNSGDNFIIAVIDCTGHGVPGAFMTMIASSGIRRIVKEDGNYNPASVLKKLNYIVKKSLQQDKEHSTSDDGLDAGICFYNAESDTLTFSGAKIPLYYVDDNELTTIKGDKTSIGYVSSDLEHEFTAHTIDKASDKYFYMTSDGYIDQLGGEKNRRLGSKVFKSLIMNNYKKPFETQKDILNETIKIHMGDNFRTDDIIVAGFKA